MTAKIDFKKDLDAYQAPRGTFRTVEVPVMQYLMVDGHGDPNTSPAYAAALEALYPVAFTLKFESKQRPSRDYVVPPLEGRWWAEDMETFTTRRDKSAWHWTMMIMAPDWITRESFTAAVSAVQAKSAPERLGHLRLESLAEGLCVQTLHIGPYDDEGPVLARMHEDFIPANGLAVTDHHHEIYLSDPRRTAPEKLRTILRQPVSART